MHCPTLRDLPPSIEGKTGWPWTEESEQLHDRMPDGHSWPRVSIVTPSYNQGQFIEETIRSVLLQGYPNLEYIIIDGGSTDNSVEIIEKYEPWLTYWVSEPDKGQSQAINKGWRKSTGDIVSWLNSDDIYEPNVFKLVARELNSKRDRYLVFGDADVVNEKGETINHLKGQYPHRKYLLRYWKRGFIIPQPGTFFYRELLDQCGLLNEEFHYAIDYELWLRFSKKYGFHYLGKTLATIKSHQMAKTVTSVDKVRSEINRASKQHWGFRFSPTYYVNFFSKNKYKAEDLRWNAYTNFMMGNSKSRRDLLIAFLRNPLFFLEKKYFNMKNVKNKYFPFIVQFIFNKKK